MQWQSSAFHRCIAITNMEANSVSTRRNGDVTPWDVTPLGYYALGTWRLGDVCFYKTWISYAQELFFDVVHLVCPRVRFADWNYHYGSVSCNQMIPAAMYNPNTVITSFRHDVDSIVVRCEWQHVISHDVVCVRWRSQQHILTNLKLGLLLQPKSYCDTNTCFGDRSSILEFWCLVSFLQEPPIRLRICFVPFHDNGYDEIDYIHWTKCSNNYWMQLHQL